MKQAKILIKQYETKTKLFYISNEKEPVLIGSYNFIDFEKFASFEINKKYNIIIWFNSLYKYNNKALGLTSLYFNVSYLIFDVEENKRKDLTILQTLKKIKE